MVASLRSSHGSTGRIACQYGRPSDGTATGIEPGPGSRKHLYITESETGTILVAQVPTAGRCNRIRSASPIPPYRKAHLGVANGIRWAHILPRRRGNGLGRRGERAEMKVVRAKRQPQRRGTGEAVARPEGPGAFIGSPLISAAVDAQGNLIRKRAADDLGMSGKELAETVGIRRDTLDKASRANAPRTQARVREMVEIVDRVKEWAGGKAQAPAWYRAQPIPAFGGRTAESLVKEGKAAALRDDLDQFAPGGFA